MQIKKEEKYPLVSIVIPHFGPSEILHSCLKSVAKSTFSDFEIVLVDNGSDFDESFLAEIASGYQYIKNAENLGFAGGCNMGIRAAKGKYVLLLNNDTTVEPGWLEPLVNAMEKDETVAACQPKLLSSRFAGKLDYAGAMGGLIDIFGYPFAIGRVFETTETDAGQYRGVYRIFWASGTASIWRKSLFDQTGYLDEDFFAHMEEIDLNWRCQLRGYKVLAISDSVVHHYSGYSLGHETWKKMYLNHRNNLIMLLKNLASFSLLWIFPARLLLELSTVLFALFTLNWRRVGAVITAFFYLIFHIPSVWRKRRTVQKNRIVPDREIFDRMYKGSVVWQSFFRRRHDVNMFLEILPVE